MENLVEKHPRVLVRTYGDRPLVRRVWAWDEGVVYITGEAELENLASGRYGPQPIPFPPEDVFCCDHVVEHHLASENRVDWNSLTKWQAGK